jgi:hypothetical protein
MNKAVMQVCALCGYFYYAFCYFACLTSKHIPQHLFLEHDRGSVLRQVPIFRRTPMNMFSIFMSTEDRSSLSHSSKELKSRLLHRKSELKVVMC